MSKSLGNGIEPEEVIKKYGAELLRLWTSSVEFWEDVTLSETILARLSEAYRKLRNTLRYMLGNTHDFDPVRDGVPGSDLLEIDQWILLRAEDLVARCRVWYDEYAFHKVYRAIYDFTTVDLSAVYFDVLKDRLYTSATRSAARRSAQTALYRLTDALVRLLAPVLTFTSEEVWTALGRSGSVHTALFPEPDELSSGISGEQRAHAAHWDTLIEVREDVLKSLETARQAKKIGAPLEAHVYLTADKELAPLLEEYRRDLPGLFIVSQVSLQNGAKSGVEVKVERAGGQKCERCWKYLPDVGAVSAWPSICRSCASAVEEIQRESHAA